MMDDDFKKLLRRTESIEKTLNLLYKDRDLLEDISIRLGKVEDEVKLLKERVDKGNKTVQAEVSDLHDKVDVIKDNLEEVTNEP